MLANSSCLEEQANTIETLLEEIAANGPRYFAANRYEISAAILNAAGGEPGDAQIAGFEEILLRTENWPVMNAGGRGFRFTGYQRAMILSLLKRDDEAVVALTKTLLPDGRGYLSDDFMGLPPDLNPLLTRLQQVPGYADWHREFNGRREQMHYAMTQMEEQGEILPANDPSL